jgi:alpha-beta hydrolase superfamily lysophospholipase
VRRPFALLCQAGVLLAALRWSHSTSGFLVTGPGLALLLDRYALRLLPWPPLAWKKELAARTVYFLGGAAAFYFMRPGNVPLREAAYRGLIVGLVAFLLELAAGLAGRSHRGWRGPLRLRLTCLALLALFVPVIAALHPLRTTPRRGPSAYGLAFEEVRFRAADGVGLAGWLVPHPESRANLVVCHGHGRNRGQVAGLLRAFHDLRLNVLAFDFRGHGDSDGHTSTFGRREVQDLRAAAAYLRDRCPGRPLLLVGVSLGAAVCLQALPDLPDVRGVWSEGAFARFGDAVDNAFAAVPACVRPAVVGGYYWLGWLDCGLWGPSLNPVERLEGARAPVYICHARGDRLVPFGQGQALYDAYRGPKGHWWVEGASHYNVRQRHHDEYLARLRAFLEQCLAGPEGVTPGLAPTLPAPPTAGAGNGKCPL